MRHQFVSELIELARADERTVLLTGDLGFSLLEPFVERYPERFFNVGVAEQNMIGLSTGLAEAGLVPYAYSIATFASMRGYEFLRNGPVLHQLPVRLIGAGAGFDYGPNGITHYPMEDIGIMRVQPGLTVIAPADAAQARSAIRDMHDHPGPVYFRLAKHATPVPALRGRFRLGRLELIGDATDVVIIALGTMAANARASTELLASQGIRTTLAIVSCLSPSPLEDLVGLLSGARLALAVEAHYVTGGLGSLVAEVIAEHGLGCRLVRAGVRSPPVGVSGSPEYLLHRHGLSPHGLAGAVVAALAPVVR